MLPMTQFCGDRGDNRKEKLLHFLCHMSGNAVVCEDKQIKATSGKRHADLANNIFRITRSLDINTNGQNKYTYSRSCCITIAYCYNLLVSAFSGPSSGR